MLEDYFSIQIFFIIFREVLETAIIISVLLSFIDQRPKRADGKDDSRRLKIQVWAGAVLGLAMCLVIGLVFIVMFLYFESDYWSYAERLWEGGFSILASVVITVMGLGLLRINKVMKVKWWVKLGDAYNHEQPRVRRSVDSDDSNAELLAATTDDAVDAVARPSGKKSLYQRYFLAFLPFITTLREGLEAVVFVGGIGLSSPPSSIPLSVLSGAIVGAIVGYVLYRGGNKLSLQYFLILSTCFLYVVSAGLMSRGVWFFELESYVRKCNGFDPSETGSGPGSYDIANSVWHVNCCNGLTDGWWMVANAIVGWTNSATYGSVSSYLVYWGLVIGWLKARLFEERHGYLPLVPLKWQQKRIRKKIKLYEAVLQQEPQPVPAEAEREADAVALLG
ncbi:hypothetical protein DIURU_000513 [Diutina rugosa]|uniref:Iron permease FTR1 n=1 Tax=Diutina rugosa TaxID=5481 RepID=A0A642UZJ8_DIURU|nr:uncharacterized protein DIURU_000513 [Diutina rugosa]KAA8907587.1 hypothetical protein DIURU_000513 [Diutina rugosa]